MPSYSDFAGNISTLQHSTNHLILLRVLFKNGAAWPEISKATIFPGDDNPACFSCKAFYTSHHRMVIIPTADLGLSDSAFPASEITNRMKIPAIRINVVKYALLIRGDRACLLASWSLALKRPFRIKSVKCFHRSPVLSLHLTTARFRSWSSQVIQRQQNCQLVTKQLNSAFLIGSKLVVGSRLLLGSNFDRGWQTAGMQLPVKILLLCYTLSIACARISMETINEKNGLQKVRCSFQYWDFHVFCCNLWRLWLASFNPITSCSAVLARSLKYKMNWRIYIHFLLV